MRNEMRQRSTYEELHKQLNKTPVQTRLTHDELLNQIKNQRKRDKLLKMHIGQLNHMKKQLEARETKTKSITTRNNWIERQNNANYRNELDRIRNELEQHSKLSPLTIKKLEEREEYLKTLFSNSNL